MVRATIEDVAKAAGLSVSTVNRALHEPDKVREQTIKAVLQAAEEIGFYGIGSIRDGLKSTRPRVNAGVLLLQRTRTFYKGVAAALIEAAKAVRDHDVVLQIEYIDEHSPQNVSDGIIRLAAKSDVIAVVTPDHPNISATIEKLSESGKKFLGLISPLSARGAGYVGIDAWKVGRTAGWAFDNFCKQPAKIAILVGNHRFRNQEANESGFRSYIREHGNGFTLLEPQSTFENANIAREVTEDILQKHPDLGGLFVCGGGISGAIAALKDSGRSNEIFVVGYDRMEVTEKALIDGTINFLISHPMSKLADEAIAAMVRACDHGPEIPAQTVVLPFDIFTPENL